MKKILVVLLLTGCGGTANFSSASSNGKNLKPVAIPWSQPGCSATKPCVLSFAVYRIDGICPVTLAGSSGWTLVATVPKTIITDSNKVFSVIDLVSNGKQVSYDIEALSNISGISYSGPSSCETIK